MANQWIRANLSAARWPLTTELAGRSVIVRGADMTFDNSVVSTDENKDRGIPQIIYMHNCMPTATGVQSIGYDKTLEPYSGGATDFDGVFPIFTPDLNRAVFVPAAGKNYVYDATVGSWVSVNPLAPGTVAASALVTAAFLRGQTYIYYYRYGCMVYDTTTKSMIPTVFTGLTLSAVNGVCASNGYLITWSDTDIAWSSITVPTDFTPSLVSGAGGGKVQEAKGAIKFILPIAGGFLIYCEQNIVSAKYSGNLQFPFILVEVPGSAGVITPERVSWQSNMAEHYAWSSNGMIRIDKSSCTLVFPEVSDFLAGLIFEDFSETTKTFTTSYLNAPLRTKVHVIAARFVTISYGVSSSVYTHVLIFDLLLQRWGKLKFDHVDCFQWNFPNLYGALTYGQLNMTIGSLGDVTTYGDLGTAIANPSLAKKQIAVLANDGSVYRVNFDLSETIANGVCVVGKFQLNRNRLITHQVSHVETVRLGSNTFQYYLLPSHLGKDFDAAVTPRLNDQSAKLAVYGRRLSCTNFSGLFMGAFNLTTYIINVNLAGQE